MNRHSVPANLHSEGNTVDSELPNGSIDNFLIVHDSESAQIFSKDTLIENGNNDARFPFVVHSRYDITGRKPLVGEGCYNEDSMPCSVSSQTEDDEEENGKINHNLVTELGQVTQRRLVADSNVELMKSELEILKEKVEVDALEIERLDRLCLMFQNQIVEDTQFAREPYPVDVYDRRSELGRGTFGSTHRMTNANDKGLYAVKEISARDAEQVGINRGILLKEASILQKLNHPHIVRYFTCYFSRQDTLFNVVMELVTGGTLAAKIKDTSVTMIEIVKWWNQLASALCYMHYEVNIQHRDIKPENIMLTATNHLKIIDLGMASIVRSSASKMSKVGTATYCSYEKAGDIPYDGRDDVWAAGCVIAELMTKSRLQERGGAIYLYHSQIINDRRLKLLADCEVVDVTYANVVRRMLEPEQEQRCTSKELVIILNSDLNALKQPNINLKEGSTMEKLSDISVEQVCLLLKSCGLKKFREKFVEDEVTGFALCEVDSEYLKEKGMSYLNIKAFLEKVREWKQFGVDSDLIDPTQNRSDDSLESLSIKLDRRSTASSWTGNSTKEENESEEVLSDLSRANSDPPKIESSSLSSKSYFKSIFSYFTGKSSSSSDEPIAEVVDVANPSDFTLAAADETYFEPLSTIEVLGKTSWKTLTIIDNCKGGNRFTYFNSKGTKIVSQGYYNNEIRLWDISNIPQILCYHYTMATQFYKISGFISNEHILVATHHFLGVLSVQSKHMEKIIENDRMDYESMICLNGTPEGSKAYSCHRDGLIRIFDINLKKLLKIIDVGPDTVYCADIDTSGFVIVCGDATATVKIFHIASGALQRSFLGHRDRVTCVKFNSSTTHIVSGSLDKTVIVWDINALSIVCRLSDHNNGICCVSWSVDDSIILSASHDKTVKVWNSTSGALIQTLSRHSGPVISAHINQYNNKIVTSSWDKTIRLWT